MAEAEGKIEDVLDDILPDWRDTTRKMAGEGHTDEEITAELQRQIRGEVDGLLDLYNSLERGRDGLADG